MNQFSQQSKKQERRRPLFFLAGIIVSLSVSLIAFEWGSVMLKRSPTASVDPFDAWEEPTEPITIIREQPMVSPPARPVEPPPPQVVNTTPVVSEIIVPVAEEPVEEEALPIPEPEPSPEPPAPVEPAAPPAPSGPKHYVGKMPHACGCADIEDNESRQLCTETAIYKQLRKNLRYPAIARERGERGTVLLMFVIGTDGQAKDFTVLRSVSPMLDRAAMAGIQRSMPCFIPGQQGEQKVEVYFKIPVNFQIR